MSVDDPWGGRNPLDPLFRNDPYPGLRLLRETDPVNLTPIGMWRRLRYADVAPLLGEGPPTTICSYRALRRTGRQPANHGRVVRAPGPSTQGRFTQLSGRLRDDGRS
jgi:hypothetical protein